MDFTATVRYGRFGGADRPVWTSVFSVSFGVPPGYMQPGMSVEVEKHAVRPHPHPSSYPTIPAEANRKSGWETTASLVLVRIATAAP